MSELSIAISYASDTSTFQVVVIETVKQEAQFQFTLIEGIKCIYNNTSWLLNDLIDAIESEIVMRLHKEVGSKR